MQRFSLLIFDLDGTLIDSFPGITVALNRTLGDFDRPTIDLEWVRNHVGRGAHRLVSAACGPSIDADIFLAAFRSHYHDILLDHSPPFAGVDTTLRTLARTYTLAVASNKPATWVESIVTHHHWDEIMAVVAGPETVGAHKPAPQMIEYISKKTGLPLAETLMIGDMTVDIETAHAAGIPVIAVTTGAASEEILSAAGPSEILSSVNDLPGWLSSAH